MMKTIKSSRIGEISKLGPLSKLPDFLFHIKKVERDSRIDKKGSHCQLLKILSEYFRCSFKQTNEHILSQSGWPGHVRCPESALYQSVS